MCPSVFGYTCSCSFMACRSATATLRLAPVLPSTVAVAQFSDIRHATNAVCDILNHGAALRKSEALQRC